MLSVCIGPHSLAALKKGEKKLPTNKDKRRHIRVEKKRAGEKGRSLQDDRSRRTRGTPIKKILANSPATPFTHASVVLTICSCLRVFGRALSLGSVHSPRWLHLHDGKLGSLLKVIDLKLAFKKLKCPAYLSLCPLLLLAGVRRSPAHVRASVPIGLQPLPKLFPWCTNGSLSLHCSCDPLSWATPPLFAVGYVASGCRCTIFALLVYLSFRGKRKHSCKKSTYLRQLHGMHDVPLHCKVKLLCKSKRVGWVSLPICRPFGLFNPNVLPSFFSLWAINFWLGPLIVFIWFLSMLSHFMSAFYFHHLISFSQDYSCNCLLHSLVIY